MPDARTRAAILGLPAIVAIALTLALIVPDNRVVFLGLWGGGSVLVYFRVFWRRRRRWLRYHDPRSFRDMVGGLALLITAGGAAFAIAMLLFGPTGVGIRGFAVALAMGCFVAAGVVMDDEEPDVP